MEYPYGESVPCPSTCISLLLTLPYQAPEGPLCWMISPTATATGSATVRATNGRRRRLRSPTPS